MGHGDTETVPDAPISRRPGDRFGAIGRYVIVDKLGSGGMGEVYRAMDPTLDPVQDRMDRIITYPFTFRHVP